jgi:hypothetical protein
MSDIPAIRSRWIHRDCKRVCVVLSVRATLALGGDHLVEYQYERTAGTTGLMPTRRTPAQTMHLAQWRSIFTKPAPRKSK